MEVPSQKSQPLQPSSYRRSSARALSRAIFAAESPETIVSTIPAEALYCIIRTDGISSSSELIELLSPEQLRSCLDFDLWNDDRLSLTTFFEWLELPDSTGELTSLERILGSLDLRLLAVLVSRYISVRIFDEPTESPPEDGFVTPDKGYTWLKVGLNDELFDGDGERLTSHQEFLLQRLLALVFDNSAELFYQILAIPSLATPAELEEEAFQDREKRMQSLGIPDREFAAALNTPISATQLAASAPEPAIDLSAIAPIAPLVAAAPLPAPLVEKLGWTEDDAVELDAEVTLLINAAVVHYCRDWHNLEKVQQIGRFVSGAIRIGIEAIIEQGVAPEDGLKTFGCQRCYAAGLHEIFTTRQIARHLSCLFSRGTELEIERSSIVSKPIASALISGLESKPPQTLSHIVEIAEEKQELDDGDLPAALEQTMLATFDYRPFQTLAEVERVRALLNQAVSQFSEIYGEK